MTFAIAVLACPAHLYRGAVAYEKFFQKIDKVLSDDRVWPAGDRYTPAEIKLLPYPTRPDYLHPIDVWTSNALGVTARFDRIKARPSFEAEVIDWIRSDKRQEIEISPPAS